MVIDENQIIKDLIDKLRKEVDNLDEAIIKLVSERTDRVSQIARLKRSTNEPMITGWREREVFSRYARLLGEMGKSMASALLSRNRSSPPRTGEFAPEDLDSSSDPKEKT